MAVSTIPAFTPAPPPMVQYGHRMIIDEGKRPACRVCGWRVTLDAESGLCVEDWRIVVLMPAVLVASGLNFGPPTK
jgi:hypothetical protein